MTDSIQYRGQYFDWLCELINLREGVYDSLIFELYSIDFEWILPLDSDREYDGMVLRESFYDTRIVKHQLKNKPCSVLEVLIALAQRFDFILDDEDRGDRTRIWFWEMIDNLGLKKFNNVYLDTPYGRKFKKLNQIRDICDIWMKRKFEYSGYGSPFPLDYPNEDQRKIDLVCQLNQYILEKHIYNDELL